MNIFYNNKNNIVFAVFDENEKVEYVEEYKAYRIGNSTFRVLDKSSASIGVGLTPPKDFAPGKYLINGGMWVINPAWPSKNK